MYNVHLYAECVDIYSVGIYRQFVCYLAFGGVGECGSVELVATIQLFHLYDLTMIRMRLGYIRECAFGLVQCQCIGARSQFSGELRVLN